MKNKMIYLKFICVILISGFIGGLCGFFIGGNDVTLKDMGAAITKTVQRDAFTYQIVVGIVMLVIMTIFFVVRQVKFKDLDQKEELLDSFDFFCNITMAVNSIHMILQFILYGILVNSIRDKIATFEILWFLAMVVFIGTVQVYVIFQIKRYNPTKKAHPLELRFCKKWMESCDEAEKYVIYAASYHSYTLTGNAMRSTAAVLILCNLVVNIGILPFIVVGVLWMIQVVSYYHWVNKLSSKKINY